jgi:hypothetical protein
MSAACNGGEWITRIIVSPTRELSFLRQEFENENARFAVGCVAGGHLIDRVI